MRRLMTLFIFFTGILLFVAAAQAGPFTYDEYYSGDLGSGLPAPTVFPFDTGVNYVIGTSTYRSSFIDLDSFAFSIPSGTQLTQVLYDFLVDFEGDIAETEFTMMLGNTGNNPLASGFIDLTGNSPVTLLGTTLPLSPETYAIIPTSSSGNWKVNYQWEFTIQAVPEPSTILLLGSGLLGLWGFRKKIRN